MFLLWMLLMFDTAKATEFGEGTVVKVVEEIRLGKKTKKKCCCGCWCSCCGYPQQTTYRKTIPSGWQGTVSKINRNKRKGFWVVGRDKSTGLWIRKKQVQVVQWPNEAFEVEDLLLLGVAWRDGMRMLERQIVIIKEKRKKNAGDTGNINTARHGSLQKTNWLFLVEDVSTKNQEWIPGTSPRILEALTKTVKGLSRDVRTWGVVMDNDKTTRETTPEQDHPFLRKVRKDWTVYSITGSKHGGLPVPPGHSVDSILKEKFPERISEEEEEFTVQFILRTKYCVQPTKEVIDGNLQINFVTAEGFDMPRAPSRELPPLTTSQLGQQATIPSPQSQLDHWLRFRMLSASSDPSVPRLSDERSWDWRSNQLFRDLISSPQPNPLVDYMLNNQSWRERNINVEHINPSAWVYRRNQPALHPSDSFLMIAVESGNLWAARKLLEHGASPDARTEAFLKGGLSPLNSEDLQTLKSLLDQIKQALKDKEEEERLNNMPKWPSRHGQCCVCLGGGKDLMASHIFVPCGHQCVCESCEKDISAMGQSRKCPMCRQPATDCIRVFFGGDSHGSTQNMGVQTDVQGMSRSSSGVTTRVSHATPRVPYLNLSDLRVGTLTPQTRAATHRVTPTQPVAVYTPQADMARTLRRDFPRSWSFHSQDSVRTIDPAELYGSRSSLYLGQVGPSRTVVSTPVANPRHQR